jgi:hypothetical protein
MVKISNSLCSLWMIYREKYYVKMLNISYKKSDDE